MSRLSIDLSDQQHQNLKALAALQGKSLKQYAIERLLPPATDDGQDWQTLRDILGQRIADGLAGAVTVKSFDAIIDDEFGQESHA